MGKNYDVVIIGGGPAGVTAAVYCARGGLSVCVIHDGKSALMKAEKIANYYGTGEIGGAALYSSGIEQARAVGADIIEGQVVFAAFDGEYYSVEVAGAAGEKYFSRRLVIATGARRVTVGIDGLAEFEGRGVSYCAVCDAFFYRNRRVAVLGDGEYAEHEYGALSVAAERYLLTNGAKPTFFAPNTVDKKIKRLFGSASGRLAGVEFEDGSTLEIDGLFVALGTLGTVGLAKSMGILTDGRGAIKVDGSGMTNLNGVYAAGDCTAGVKQIARAVADGMNVGLSVIAAAKKESEARHD